MEIIVRHAHNDFAAYQTAQGMENAGAKVFSVSLGGTASSPFLVWAKYEYPVTPSMVDECINKVMDEP